MFFLAIVCSLSCVVAQQQPGMRPRADGPPPMVQNFIQKLAAVHANPSEKAQILDQMKNWMTQHGGTDVDAKLAGIGKIFDKASAMSATDFRQHQQDLAWQIFMQMREPRPGRTATETPAAGSGRQQGQFSRSGMAQNSHELGGKGYRVFTIGHSFHNWLPGWLKDVVHSAGIEDLSIVGVSAIGGSEVIEHWNVPDERNQAKAALVAGTVDVLTMSPKWRADEGIDKFAALALEHNPNIRITVQEFWMPYDELRDFGDLGQTLRTWKDPEPDPDPRKENRNTARFNVPTGIQLRNLHEPYFKSMDQHIDGLNKQFGEKVLFIVPVGQAVIALREMVAAGKVPGIAKQSDLFMDKNGHPKPPICALAAYCHFAVIYHQSPVGLPIPPQLAKDYNIPKLNRLLQEIAWDAVIHHRLSGTDLNNQAAKSSDKLLKHIVPGSDGLHATPPASGQLMQQTSPISATQPALSSATGPHETDTSAIQWIDVHNHFYPDNFEHADFSDSVRVALAQMDQAGIRKKILLPPPPGIRPDERFLKACQHACRSHPGRFAFGCCADLNAMIKNSTNVTDALRHEFEHAAEEIVRQGACSFGEMFVSHLLAPAGEKPLCFGVEADHPLLLVLADVSARYGVPIDVHFDLIAEDHPSPEHAPADLVKSFPNLFCNKLPAFERLLDHNPKARICWQHAGSDWYGYLTVDLCRRLLQQHPNLYMSLGFGRRCVRENAPLSDDQQIRPEWLRLFHDFPDRFVIGSDSFIHPNDEVGGRLSPPLVWTRRFLNALPPDLARKIASDNAIALFKLKD